MKHTVPYIIEKDSQGRIVFEQHEDGFQEYITYSEKTGKIIKDVCIYPNGLREVEQFTDD